MLTRFMALVLVFMLLSSSSTGVFAADALKLTPVDYDPFIAEDCEKAGAIVKEANGLIAKDSSKAESLYQDSVNLCRDSASAHYNLGLARFNKGDFSSAAVSFKEAIRLNPRSVEAMNGLALSYASQGINYGESKTLIEDALKISPNDSILKESVSLIEASRKPPYIIADLVIEDSDGNNILDAGEDVVFKFSVENKGKGAAINLVATSSISNETEFLKELKDVGIGNVMPGEKIEKVVNLRIPYSVKTGEYKLGVTVVEESGRYGAAPMEYTIPVKSPVPPRFVVNAQMDDDMAGDSSGNGNGVIEKGETIEIHLSVSNEGSGVAKNVIARIKAAVEGIGLVVSEARLGNIPHQKGVDGTLAFSVPMTFKGDRLPVEIVIEEETGLFTARNKQNFAVAEAVGKKMKIGSTLLPDEKAASPARFSFATAPVENIAEAVHRLNISAAKEHKDYFAVVIGIEKYRDIKSDAMYAVKDAEWVREYLIKGVGIPKANIRTLINENATKGDIEKTVEVWLRNKVKGSNSMVFFYYSGHGAPDVKGDTEVFIVPYDGDPDYLEKTAYPLKSLYESLSQLPSGNVIAVLDSCFAGRGDRSVLASGVKPIVLEVKNPYIAMGNTVVLAAAEPKEVSSAYSEAGHGLFTYYLLRGLNGEADANGDGWVELNELYTYTDTKVTETAGEMNREQHPVISPRIEDIGERGKIRLTKVK